MKRFAAFILFLVYLVTSTGASLHLHYCMGEMASSTLWGDTEKLCGKCGMDMEDSNSNGCCKDEMYWIKIDDDQKTSTAYTEIPKWLLDANNLIALNTLPPVFIELLQIEISKAPLRSSKTPHYLRNCVFLI